MFFGQVVFGSWGTKAKQPHDLFKKRLVLGLRASKKTVGQTNTTGSRSGHSNSNTPGSVQSGPNTMTMGFSRGIP